MPIPVTLARRWPARTISSEDAPRAARRARPGLIAAVAAIVAVAAERAQATGDLGALRDALEAALDAAGSPPDLQQEGAAEMPHVADADPAAEAARLRALLARMPPG